uniref:NADH dehydrogenase subunit 1 n=1 Tax=Madagascaria erythrocladioides TaxID=753684 RepID=UPI001FCCC7A0|nr:NADH dehydrogenase subunit 1 [Madagascaria erythrocladioides]UNJ18781.1 NADH dehydrogenase subunit 1 [Madagascaria erythrocladioides]
MLKFFFIVKILKFLTIIIPLLIAVAFLTLAERKVMGAIHKRKGPNVVGVYGLLQPLADGLKLFTKETILPTSANLIIFILAPILTFLLALVAWTVIPFEEGLVYADLNLGVLYLLAISSLGVYGIIISGWSSNSKYAFLGALRSAAQMVSYEVSMGLILISVLLCTGSLNLTQIVLAQQQVWFLLPLFPLFFMFYISILAETNRAPFDLSEAEAELVSGYNVEYAAMGFALFFLGEYSNMILMCSMTTIFFLGGWLPPFNIIFLSWIPGELWFGIKTTLLLYAFIWVRSTFPRYRYDQLMRLGWKILLPLSLAWVIFIAAILLNFNILLI